MSFPQSLWAATSNASNQRAELNETIHSDVAIIGGGFTGLASAYFLSKAGKKVVVVEKERIGWGASGRNAGMLTTGYKKSIFELEKKLGTAKAKELMDMSADCVKLVKEIVDEHQFDCALETCGGIKVAYKPSHFEKMKKEHEHLLKSFQYETELVDANDIHSEINSPMYQYGGLIDRKSFAFHPLNYVIGLADIAEKMGASIYENTEVISINKKHGNNERFIVKTAKGEIKCKHIIIATNGYTSEITKRLAKSIMPIGSHIIATQPLPDQLANQIIPNKRVVSDTKNFLYYFRLTADQRMLFGGRVSFSTNSTPNEYDHIYSALHENLLTVFPDLKGMDVDYRWGGTTGFTFDFMPHIGETEDGMHFALGYCGHGAAMSTLLGKILAYKITGVERTETVLESLPLRTIPLHGQRVKVLNLVGYYYKIADQIS
ncbi:NAD(P)/FAD-dependent oxidoreductase [Bacillus sp. UNC41MFS5]|uniref:NAD(P)/FAD-dependent oxidoreductase n=1 Tax=Bacillus sp. UNC41MFS5 TaxID=1449046 RepID=UPI00047C644A|nr:FAD-binding oxidoreductase [Bacillus sp. UNC41MFS5]